jgi:hypothetical protein
MTLGSFREGIAASFALWSEQEYQRQWLEGARRLLDADSCSAFITDVTDPPTACVINWWPAWRVDDLIVLQNHLLCVGAKEGDELHSPRAASFSLQNPYAAIPARDEGHTEECRRTGLCRRPKIGSRANYADGDVCVSEWCVFSMEMKEFLERRTKDWVR